MKYLFTRSSGNPPELGFANTTKGRLDYNDKGIADKTDPDYEYLEYCEIVDDNLTQFSTMEDLLQLISVVGRVIVHKKVDDVVSIEIYDGYRE